MTWTSTSKFRLVPPDRCPLGSMSLAARLKTKRATKPMITQQDVERTITHFEKVLMSNDSIQSISVVVRHSLTGEEEFVIEVGVLNLDHLDLPNSLPLVLADGTLSGIRIPVSVVVTGYVDKL